MNYTPASLLRLLRHGRESYHGLSAGPLPSVPNQSLSQFLDH